ncbi:hypothetical protein Pan241w_37550 [Gimesia alba]|uniref:Uncharacterized protein n=1 Tax=Gimesia alba TaxID=2527973 RepID=A0A517RIG9_9PLAN|nr:hypothetical protein Pan241w_37550 [Gimesia alba]
MDVSECEFNLGTENQDLELGTPYSKRLHLEIPEKLLQDEKYGLAIK